MARVAKCRTFSPKRKGMNKLEEKYSQTLEQRRIAGEIAWWGYEAQTLKLAERTTYTPDFLVIRSDGRVECHETKGFFRDDARVKLKIAAEKYPFYVFYLVQEKHKDWVITEITNGRA